MGQKKATLNVNMQSDQDPEFSRLLSENVTQYKAPDRLRRRIVESLEEQRRSSWRGSMSNITEYIRGHWQTLAAAAATGVATTLIGSHMLMVTAYGDALTQQVVSSHIRSSVSTHPIDVASSDRHTVKPWFVGKLDYSPQVQDYVTAGFELVGGRLDYVNDRVVAALVYKRRLHMIDAYSWPTKEAAKSISRRSQNGINVLEWRENGMQFYLASDIEDNELAELARLMRRNKAI